MPLTQASHVDDLDYRRPVEPNESPPVVGEVKCRERLGGLLKSYYRGAA
jgi:hypothetical protein